jgi:hypothetical protein
VRRDLPLGVQVAQTIHAAGESIRGPLPPQTRAVALAADDEAALWSLEERLIALDIAHVAIREIDAPYCGALMAIGVVPAARTPHLRRVLGRYPLLR